MAKNADDAATLDRTAISALNDSFVSAGIIDSDDDFEADDSSETTGSGATETDQADSAEPVPAGAAAPVPAGASVPAGQTGSTTGEGDSDAPGADKTSDKPEPEDEFSDLYSSPLFAEAIEIGVPRAIIERAVKSDALGAIARLQEIVEKNRSRATTDSPRDAAPTTERVTDHSARIDEEVKTLVEKGVFDEEQAKALKSMMNPILDMAKSSQDQAKKVSEQATRASRVRDLQETVSTAEAMFSKVDPDGSIFGYGKGDSVSLKSKDPKAFTQRSKVFELGIALHELRGYPRSEAMSLAHNAVNASKLRETVRKEIEDQLSKAGRSRTAPPSKTRAQEKGAGESSSTAELDSWLNSQ